MSRGSLCYNFFMPQTVTIDQKTASELVTSIRELTREVASLKKAVRSSEPKYGSKEWWDAELEAGEEDIKAGRYTVYDNANDLIADLHAGK